jgi:hypothetical protein
MPRPTVLFASLSPMKCHLELAAALRRRGYRVERFTPGTRSFLPRPERLIERLVFHKVVPALGSRAGLGEPQVGELEKRLSPSVLDIQADDHVAAAFTKTSVTRPGFPRRTAEHVEESDLYDKVVMNDHAAATGWPVPQTWVIGENVDAPWPRMIKPRLGNGGECVLRVRNQAEFDDTISRSTLDVNLLFAQEYVPGGIVRAGGIAHAGALIQGACWRTTPPADDPFGPAIAIEVYEDPGFIKQTEALLQRLGYTGLFDIDGMKHEDGTVTFIEFNSRIWGSWATGNKAGLDLVGAYVEVMEGRPQGAQVRAFPAPPRPVNSIRLNFRELGWRWTLAAALLRIHHVITEWLSRRRSRADH